MPKKFVNPKDPKAGPAYPNDAADEETMRKIGYFEEGYPKQMYRDGEEPREVISSDEERGLGKGWRGFDEALRKIGGSYRERFKAAVNNPAEQARILAEYHTLHPALARADSWYKETAPQIPQLQTQAMLKLVSDRHAEGRERRAIEAKVTEAPAANHRVKTGKPPQELKDAKHAKEEKHGKPFEIGKEVHSLVSRCREGQAVLRKAKAKNPTARHIWKGELLQKGFSEKDFEILLMSTKPESAACRIVAQKHAEMELKTVQNHYSAFKRS